MMRRALIAFAVAFVAIALGAPLVVVFASALRDGVGAYARALVEPDARAALRLTLAVAAIAVPINAAFGLAAAWAVARFTFPGRRAVVALIELPLAVPPVIAGMLIVLVYGAHGLLGGALGRIVFAPAGIVVVTAFVTTPFVARALAPALEARGPAQELAALTLGASAWQTFWRITLPSVRRPLAYGAILCAARAVGEFGAVSVVSGHIRGETTTVPLHVEILYNDFHTQAAFAVASLLAVIALVTVAIERALAWRRAA